MILLEKVRGLSFKQRTEMTRSKRIVVRKDAKKIRNSNVDCGEQKNWRRRVSGICYFVDFLDYNWGYLLYYLLAFVKKFLTADFADFRR